MIIEVILLLLLLILLYNVFKTKKNYPPGPLRIPYIGSTKFPKTDSEALAMSKKYGDLFMCQIGISPFLFLADYKLSKEALSMPVFSNRPTWKILQAPVLDNPALKNESLGLLPSNGLRWQHNRRFVLRHLRDLGMGKSRLEGAIQQEIEELVKHLRTVANAPSEFTYALNIAILNVIWQLCASTRYDFDDKMVQVFMEKTTAVEEVFLKSAVLEFFPILKYIVPKYILDKKFGASQFPELLLSVYEEFTPIINEHKKTLDPDNSRDLIDDYLIAMEENKGKTDSFFAEDDLRRCLADLFAAGNDTVSNTTNWFILYMIKYPSIQRQAQKEIDSVVDREVLPSLIHRDSLPFIDAIVNEVLRFSSFFNFGISHAAESDTIFKDYFIPKDCVLLTMAGMSHGDPRYWKNPEEFDPTRFLDSDGKFMMNMPGHQAFGVGRRQCLGEPLARMELFLLTSALLQNFTFSPPPGVEIDITPREAIGFRFPKKQKLLIQLRE